MGKRNTAHTLPSWLGWGEPDGPRGVDRSLEQARTMAERGIVWGSKTQITLATSAFGMGPAGIQAASISAV